MELTTARSVGRATSGASTAAAEEMPLQPIGLTQSAMFPLVAALTAIAVVLAAALPDPNSTVSFGIVATAVMLVGVPHGAVDHLVAAGPEEGDRTVGSQPFDRRFHMQYVTTMLVVAIVWFAVPVAALIAFLIVSAHHFGQSDLAWCRLPTKHQLALQWSRGLLLVAFPLVAHLDTIAPIVDGIGGGRPDRWPWLEGNATAWCVGLLVQHVVVGAVTGCGANLPGTLVRREVIGVAMVTSLFAVADPLIGFAVYFGLWHSLGHVLVLRQVLVPRTSTRGEPMRWSSFARLALPRTVMASGGIAIVLGAMSWSDRSDDAVAMLFVLVSVVTVPHLVAVERLWRKVRVQFP